MNADTTQRSDETAATSGGRTTTRGQSEVIAVVLLLVIVVLSLSVLVASGTTAIVETRDRAEIGAAEHALAAFDTDVSAVAFGQSRATTDLGLRANDGEVRYYDTGWIRVAVDNETSARTVVVNESLGTVEYRQAETTVASQGGGVWRSDGDGSVMLSRPEFHYRDRTLTLPVVSIDGETGLTSRLDSRPDGPLTQQYPNRTAGFSNPPDSGSVTVTVQSAYYDAWGRYFEDETDAIVTYDHASERVTATFVVLPGHTTFDAGIIATSSTGELAVAGTGAYVNSYDSSAGNYSQTNSANGLIQSAGDVTATGDSLVDGDVKSGGTVNLQGSTEINGSAYWTKAPEPDSTEKSKVAGDVERIDGVRSVMPIDTFVATYAEQVKDENDNDETSAITDDQLTTTGSSTELDAGRYYVHNVTLDGESMTLNTTDGDVTVVVRDYVKLEQGGNITVEGDGIARFVVAGENDTTVSPTGLGSKSVNFHVGKKSAVHVPGEDSRSFRVYGTRDFNATIAGSNSKKATFDGLVYAPAGTNGSGYVYIKQGDLYGLAVTGNLTVGQYGAAHYDYGLKGKTRIRSPFSELEQLYVTVHRVQVESEG
ncbi:hypothetical protein [Haloarcula sp. JP-L23]|uniref:DUF7289 family protein n=1 Tax=Haloarcula sp. JP-L23 TaxID=2716717 RepID=UPI001D0578BE